MDLKFRYLRADEIECRVAQVTDKGVSLLLYKDARVDQNLLDEVVGTLNWKKHYDLIDGQLFCTLEIWDPEKNQWISKQDVGVESNTEAEKGRASDAQKRAAFCFGIGRELYTAPFIWIPVSECNISSARSSGKPTCYDRFYVKAFNVENGQIVGLEIVNANRKKVVFSIGKKVTTDTTSTNTVSEESDPVQETNNLVDANMVKTIKSVIKKKGLTNNSILQYYKKTTFEELTVVEFTNAMNLLAKYKDKE